MKARWITVILMITGLMACSQAEETTQPVAGQTSNDRVVVTLYRVDDTGMGEAIGTLQAEDTDYGLLLTPDLEGLEQGIRGFHVHQNPDCGPAINDDGETVPALAAGGHYDPEGSEDHHGPYDDNGHLGDMPALYFDADERATLPVLAPRLKVADLRGRALVLHAGGDNYSDDPAALGGGGARAACGVVE